jgi:putative flavoprotein involved in K+ transport
MQGDMLDVLIIGAGQAGLALGYYLKQTPHRFLLVDGNERIGDSWRKRYDSLVLFTPRAYSALPGLPAPGDPDGYPTKDEIAAYLEAYAAHFHLPIQTETRIHHLERNGSGFRATTDGGDILDARAVVLATGAFQRPAIPAVAQGFAEEVVQFTTESYSNPSQVPAGTVLLVGDGATGRQIACELAPTHRVILATGRARRAVPETLLGRSLFWWMDRLGLLRASRESWFGKWLIESDSFPGNNLKLDSLRRQGIHVTGRLQSAAGRTASFADGSRAGVDAVIWATGYRDQSEWVAIPEVKDERGNFVQQRGVSPVPNFYFIGRSWQWSRGSALLTGVGEDALYLLREIEKGLQQPVYNVQMSALAGSPQ